MSNQVDPSEQATEYTYLPVLVALPKGNSDICHFRHHMFRSLVHQIQCSLVIGFGELVCGRESRLKRMSA